MDKVKKRKKLTPLPSLIAKADRLASQFIRQKYAENGLVKCVSCETVLPWKDAHCAHYFGRAAKATRWVEENLHPACPSCNVYRKEHHMREYTLYMIDRYGRPGVNDLKNESRKVLSGSQIRQLADEAIEYFGNALKNLS